MSQPSMSVETNETTTAEGRASNEKLVALLHVAAESKDADVSTIRSVVMRALSDASLFAGYDQIRAVLAPTLQAGGHEGTKMLHTLDLFSYGILADYVTDQDKYMNLTDAQVFKLRQLTLLTLAEDVVLRHERQLPYAVVQAALQLPTNDNSSRDVEEVLMACLYENVLHGRLCQKSRALVLDPTISAPVVSRDIQPSDLTDMLARLQTFDERLRAQQTQATQRLKLLQEKENAQATFDKQAKEYAEYNKNDKNSNAAAAAASRRQKRSRGASNSVADVIGGMLGQDEWGMAAPPRHFV